MKTKKVNRYWCDFCNKAGLSAGHMRKHEVSCTANPNRVCRMCKMVESSQQKPIRELMVAIDRYDRTLAKLRAEASGCPACMLSALRQSGILKWDGDPESYPPSFDFDFKGECKAIWQRINEEQARDEQYA